ncbi:MAG TPA: beta-N-acetylhexosaminidase [Mucilaginibacter sp.]|nr:beta-N-acetylhexosaminidase [Mucilaginibacter sp.]
MKARVLILVFTLFFAKISLAKPVDGTEPFKIRGFHLDLRIQVMKMPALKNFALKLSKQGINTLVMEWEATYPFLSDPLIPNRFAYTRQEVKDFIKYCQTLHIDVIPLQQSFGHVEYILRNYKYAALREDDKDFSQVCPSEPELNKELFTRLFKDMVSLHPSPYFHIGGDETHLLGHCEKCKKRAAEVGISRLYFDHIKMLCDIVVSLGKRPVVWADIALNYPQYISLLPKETIFVDWNYGWDMNRFGAHDELVKSGYEIWGAPAIRSSPDNYFLTKWQTHFNNIRDFLPICKKLGYQGMIMTSWSTSGVYSPSYESEDDLVDLAALRHVYPISGFDMLIDAYTKAVQSDNALNVYQFIDNYCRVKFGFDVEASQKFRKGLFMAPYTVSSGKVHPPGHITMSQLKDSVQLASSIFHSLQPKLNSRLFDHYKLMADIRLFYVDYMEIEKEVNSADLNQQKIPGYLARLKKLMNEAPDLDKRFAALNQEVLYPAAIAEENTLRDQKISILYNRLARIK